MKAIEETLAQRRFDEITLSTLPPGISLGLPGTSHIVSEPDPIFR
jgi:hypothetical protein